MKRIAALILIAAAARADVPTLRWDVETSRPAAQLLELYAGETVRLDARFLSYGAPLSLADVWDVVLRYRSADMPEDFYYAATGAVVNASAGLVRVIWTPEAVGHTNSYVYTLAAKTVGGDIMRGLGAIRVRNVVQGSVTNMPRAVTTTFDWGSVEHINIGSAPFLSVADILSLENAIAALTTGKVDRTEWASTNAGIYALIAGIEVGGGGGGPTTLAGDVTGPSTNSTVIGLRGVPVSLMTDPQNGHALKFDAATQSLMLGPVASEVGGSYSNVILVTGTNTRFSVGNNQAGLYRIMRPGNIPSMAVNVDGTEVAYYDLLGMTVRFGTLSLLNSNLSANVRHYDGSAAQPAAAWVADPQTGRYRISYQAGSGEAYATAGQTVWYWTADGIHLAPGKSLFADGVVAETENDPLSLQTSAWYVAHSDAGPYSIALSNATPAVFCSNGLYSASYSDAGIWLQTRAQISADALSWGPYEGEAIGSPVYFRIQAYDVLPGSGEEEPLPAAVSNIVIHSWARPQLVDRASDLAGQTVRVDWPAAARDVANKDYVDVMGAANWSQHAATQEVRMAANRLWFDGRWSMIGRGQYTAVSYGADMAVSTNRWSLDFDGAPILSANLGGQLPLPVLDFMVATNEGASIFVLSVATNGVTSAPYPQWSSNMVNWANITPFSGHYPVATNGAYIVWWTNDYNMAFFRAAMDNTNVVERLTAHRPLDLGQQPLILRNTSMTHAPNHVTVLSSAATVSIARDHGPNVALVVTNPTCRITFSPDWLTNDIGRVRMDLIRGTNVVTLNTNTISGTITNSAVSSIEFDKQWSRTLWRVIRQW